ncbi:MAG TPA: hypothetical protein VKM00_02750, partial [Luteimonas sp.]|nr:hypothetical protein [Luteimonas sp.]
NFMKKPFSRAEVFTYIERLLDEEFVPRRFNTFVHDTTLEPEQEEAEEQIEATDELAAAPTVESVGEAVAETTAAAPATEMQAAAAVTEPSAAASTAEIPAAAPVAEPLAIAAVVETPTSAPVAEPPVAAPVVEQTTLSFAEMVEALLENSPDEPPADSSPAATSAEPAPTASAPAPEPAARDIFADINAGWRRPVQRTPPPG